MSIVCIMYYAYLFLIVFLCLVRTKRSKPCHAAAIESASETEGDAGDDSLMSLKSSATVRYCMGVKSNNVISLLHLALANQVPSKTRDSGTEKCFGAAHTLSKAYTLLTLILNGSKMPVEQQRDSAVRMFLLRSAGPSSIRLSVSAISFQKKLNMPIFLLLSLC